MATKATELKFGWIPQKPDWRDLPFPSLTPAIGAGEDIDISKNDTPIYDQNGYGACTGFACKSVFEYWEKNYLKAFTDESAMFIYKEARDALGITGDGGATLRAVANVVHKQGVPPTAKWKYTAANLNKEPTKAVKTLAAKTEASGFYQLDTAHKPLAQIYSDMRATLSTANLPIMAGFTVYTSYDQAQTNGGMFPFPSKGEKIAGGHAIEVCGDHPNMEITNENDGSKTVGAFKIKNSWGLTGDKGYYYLPHAYLLKGMLTDMWVITNETHLARIMGYVPGGRAEAHVHDPTVIIQNNTG
jgi:C1A family cysteine protease